VLPAIPNGAKIQAAILKLSFVKEGYSATTGDGAIKVYLIKKPWIEGGKNHVCWNVPWTKPGCADDSDRDPKPIGELKLAKGEMPGFHTIDVTEGVRQWASGQAPKEGFLIQVEGTGQLFPG